MPAPDGPMMNVIDEGGNTPLSLDRMTFLVFVFFMYTCNDAVKNALLKDEISRLRGVIREQQ